MVVLRFAVLSVIAWRKARTSSSWRKRELKRTALSKAQKEFQDAKMAGNGSSDA